MSRRPAQVGLDVGLARARDDAASICTAVGLSRTPASVPAMRGVGGWFFLFGALVS
jgi:hypothetical protein